MGTRGWEAAGLGVLSAIVLTSGCVVKRMDDGVFHSSKGYRVEIPGAQWAAVDESPADLELRHRALPAAMAASAVCAESTARRPSRALARQLFIGVRQRQVIERDEIEIAGRRAARAVVDARLEGSEQRVRIETLVVKDERCVYDFMYAAAPGAFAELRPDFARFIESFRTD